MLTAYLDESGQEQDDWMFLAGFYGNDESWKMAAREWLLAIGPQRTNLHMNSLRFNRESERQMLIRVGAVPTRCGLTGIVGGVRQGDFKDLISGSPEERVLSGYIVCLWCLLINTLRSLPDGERLELVFEIQEQYQMFAHIALSEYVNNSMPHDLLPNGKHKLASWRWVGKGDTSLTEIADCFAFSLTKAYREPGSVKHEWCRPMLNNNGGRGYGAIMNRDWVRSIISDGMLNRSIDFAKQRLQEAYDREREFRCRNGQAPQSQPRSR